MVFNKKGISPVVATALLLVVAVVAVVGFQTWFNTYQSGLNVKVEQQSKAGSSLTIERLEVANSGQIYVKNNAVDNVSISSWKVTLASTGADVANCGETSGVLDAAAGTVTTYNSSSGSCSLTAGKSYNVIVVSDAGVFSANLLAK